MTKAIDWNMALLFGDGGLVLSLGIESSGIVPWIDPQISYNIASKFTSFSIFAIAAIMGFIMSYTASKTASAIITCPIAATLTIGVGFNSISPILAAGLAPSISSAIPSLTATPLLPMAIVYSLKTVYM